MFFWAEIDKSISLSVRIWTQRRVWTTNVSPEHWTINWKDHSTKSSIWRIAGEFKCTVLIFRSIKNFVWHEKASLPVPEIFQFLHVLLMASISKKILIFPLWLWLSKIICKQNKWFNQQFPQNYSSKYNMTWILVQQVICQRMELKQLKLLTVTKKV